MGRLFLPLACIVGSTDGARVSRQTAESNTECSGFENLTVRGKDVGKVASTVCQNWPKSILGAFPYDTADKMYGVADAVLEEGGLYDQISKIWDDRNANTSVCWRRFLFPTSESLLEASSVNPFDYDDIDLFNLFAPRLDPVITSLSEAGVNNTLGWADCPGGYSKDPLTGWALGMCKSNCETPGMTHNCSLTCTAGWWSCTKTVVDQADAMLSALGKIASFIFNNDAISSAVDAVIDLTDFVVKVLQTMIKAVKSSLSSDKKEGTAALLTALFQLLIDNEKFLGETADTLKKKFADVTGLIADVIQEGFDSSSFSWNSLADKMLKSGSAIMDSTLDLTNAFLYPRCAIGA